MSGDDWPVEGRLYAAAKAFQEIIDAGVKFPSETWDACARLRTALGRPLDGAAPVPPTVRCLNCDGPTIRQDPLPEGGGSDVFSCSKCGIDWVVRPAYELEALEEKALELAKRLDVLERRVKRPRRHRPMGNPERQV